jgi:VIT1/CCC1 family predicted Fe2+/Mn2+ transporter
MSTHVERHFTASEVVRDVVIGMSDGLTVPFALAAGLSGAVGNAGVIVTAGFAEIAAGAIAMGLGGYLAAKSDVDHYAIEQDRERREVREKPEVEEAEITELFAAYGITEEESQSIVVALRRRPEAWVDFMMRFELGLEKPEPKRALTSALTISGSYIVGGIIPLGPYLMCASTKLALMWSSVATLVALAAFGYSKGRLAGTSAWRGALQTALIGGLAATAAFLIARAIA